MGSPNDGLELDLTGISVEDIKRFLKKIKLGGAEGCDLWVAGVNDDGYGQFWWKGRSVKASRFAYALFSGEIVPAGKTVNHSCDNPRCVRGGVDGHLSLGTQKSNLDERGQRNRTARPKGESNGRAILDEEKVREVNRLWLLNTYTLAEIGQMVGGVAGNTICYIVKGRNWSWLNLDWNPTLRATKCRHTPIFFCEPDFISL